MKLPIATALTTLLAFAQAAPATSSEPDLQARSARHVNDCGKSTFENQSSKASPLVADCRQLARNIANGGTWVSHDPYWTSGNRDVPKWQQLAKYGTCAFGIKATSGEDMSGHDAKVGNEDIINIIHTSISKFEWHHKVGAKGTMYCQGDVHGWYLTHWGIYNPKHH